MTARESLIAICIVLFISILFQIYHLPTSKIAMYLLPIYAIIAASCTKEAIYEGRDEKYRSMVEGAYNLMDADLDAQFRYKRDIHDIFPPEMKERGDMTKVRLNENGTTMRCRILCLFTYDN